MCESTLYIPSHCGFTVITDDENSNNVHRVKSQSGR